MRTTHAAVWQLAVLVPLAACAGPGPWRQVDGTRIITITGRLEVLDMPAAGDVRLEVTPRPGDQHALAPGQQRMICIVPARNRNNLETQLLNLVVGKSVAVSGYWMARDETGGTRHYLADTTDIVPIDT